MMLHYVILLLWCYCAIHPTFCIAVLYCRTYVNMIWRNYLLLKFLLNYIVFCLCQYRQLPFFVTTVPCKRLWKIEIGWKPYQLNFLYVFIGTHPGSSERLVGIPLTFDWGPFDVLLSHMMFIEGLKPTSDLVLFERKGCVSFSLFIWTSNRHSLDASMPNEENAM